MTGIRIEERGARLYVVGNTFPIKDRLDAIGCHFDGQRRQWWIGKTKRAALEQLLDEPAPSEREVAARQLARDRDHIIGRAKFEGHSYYVVADGHNERGGWVRLLTRDGERTFFKDAREVELVKSYEKPKTLADLKAYAERMKRERETGVCECWCHSRSDCTCDAGFCMFHHDGCDSCGCEN